MPLRLIKDEMAADEEMARAAESLLSVAADDLAGIRLLGEAACQSEVSNQRTVDIAITNQR